MKPRTAIAAGLALALAGCAAHPPGPYTPLDESARDPTRAAELTQRASGQMLKDPKEAERLLREALTADLYHGPAHNNLGVLFLREHRLYEAAGEFQWAAKLIPGHPDPRMNLALTYEKAGRTEEALAEYAAALDTYPGHLPSVQGLARLQVRSGKRDERTEDLLREIALRGETDAWRSWARLVLSKEPR